ncbi:6613_t:CDS:2 [Ambispora leptoticha]|uniref:6613_t:CDS:1 n=1 Tax=Ambispora leptoticha TaxID=144679 RepID=A0A9N9F1A4_9GLOM|nr:6613_t:CDS:2 [Ambispora leptoticha]
MVRLGECLRRGDGTLKNEVKAFYWCNKAAAIDKNNNKTLANCLIADFYSSGIGIKKDVHEALKVYHSVVKTGQLDVKRDLKVALKKSKHDTFSFMPMQD